MVGVGWRGVWALVRWLTYSLMAMPTVWRGRGRGRGRGCGRGRGRDVEEAPSRRTARQVESGRAGSVRAKPGVESSRVPSAYRIGIGPSSPQRVEVRPCRPTIDRTNEHAIGPSRDTVCERLDEHTVDHWRGDAVCKRQGGGERKATSRCSLFVSIVQEVSEADLAIHSERPAITQGMRLGGTWRL